MKDEPRTSKEKGNANRELIEDTIRKNPGIRWGGLMEKLVKGEEPKMCKRTLNNHLKILCELPPKGKGTVIKNEEVGYRGRGKSYRYYLTEEAIREPNTQVEAILQILKSKITDCLDYQSIYDDVKDKRICEMIEENIIDEGLKEAERERVDDVSAHHRQKSLEASRKNAEYLYEIITFDPGFKKEEIADMDKKELIDFEIMGWLVGTRNHSGPLLKTKIVSANHFVVSELLERSKANKKTEERKLYYMIIKNLVGMMGYYGVGELSDWEKEDIKKIMEDVLGMDPLDRYVEYAKVMEKSPFLTDYERTKTKRIAMQIMESV